METDRTRLKHLIKTEIAAIGDTALRAHVQSLLIEPISMRCAWDYGEPDETYPCWKVVGEPNVEHVGIIYCDYGFGPKHPWGLVFVREATPSMGMDSGWFSTFREAAADMLDLPPSSLNVC